MSLFHTNTLIGASGSGADSYTIERSLRFNSGDSSYLSRSPSSAGNRQTFTLSWWMKRCDIASTNRRIFGKATGTNQFSIMHEGNGRFYCFFDLDSPTDTSELTFDVKLVDPSAWYHCVMAFDTTQSTDSDRVKFWLNGVLQNNNMALSNWPSQNASFKWNENLGGLNYFIGGISGFYTNTYLTEIYNIDGQALQASDFGEYDSRNVWVPKEYEGTFGTNGFYLNFSDDTSTSTIAADQSGQGNDWTANNISVSGTGTDSMLDSPTNGTQTDTGAGGEVSGNYATFNPISMGNVTLSDGNLTANAVIDNNVTGTIAIPEDVKIYFEFTVDQRGGGGTQSPIVGVCLPTLNLTQNADSQISTVWAYASTGNKLGGGSQYVAHGNSLSANDVLGVAVDRANGRIWFSKNGTWQNSSDPTNGSDSNAAFTNVPTTGTILLFYGNNNTTPGTGTLNCGQRAFSYNAPSGYKVLNTTNLPDPTIADGSTAMDIVTYAGNGTTKTLSGLNFSPDFIWIKERTDAGGTAHYLGDTVRGVNKNLQSNGTNTEVTNHPNGYISAVTSDGFTVTAGSSDSFYTNGSPETYVAWAWDGGTSNTSISAGDLNSSVYDQSQVWSTNATLGSGNIYSDGGGVDHVPSRIFDGDSSTSCIPEKGTASSEVSLDLTSTIAGVTKIRVQTASVDNFKINGGSNIASTGNGYQTIYDGAAITLTSLKFIRTSGVSGGSSDTGFSVTSVEINGKQLIDSGVSVTNVPSIASTVRANPSAGFSIVTFTGNGTDNATVGHGLGVTPSFVIQKSRTLGNYWAVYHSSLASGTFLRLDLDLQALSESNYWKSFSSTVMTLPASGTTLNNVNNTDETYVAYCFAPVAGFSQFGRYSGNADVSNGNFVYLPFRPAFLLIKDITSTGYWYLTDSARNPTNDGTTNYVWANTSGAERSGYSVDLLSNGFRLLSESGNLNGSSRDYIYAAFAEHPFKTARAR